MSTESTAPATFSNVIPPELKADTQAVIAKLMTGAPLDAETYERVRREVDRVRDETLRKHGLLDIGVPAIRELRGE